MRSLYCQNLQVSCRVFTWAILSLVDTHCYKEADIYSNLQYVIYVIMYIFKQKDGEVAQCSLAKKNSSIWESFTNPLSKISLKVICLIFVELYKLFVSGVMIWKVIWETIWLCSSLRTHHKNNQKIHNPPDILKLSLPKSLITSLERKGKTHSYLDLNFWRCDFLKAWETTHEEEWLDKIYKYVLK